MAVLKKMEIDKEERKKMIKDKTIKERGITSIVKYENRKIPKVKDCFVKYKDG